VYNAAFTRCPEIRMKITTGIPEFELRFAEIADCGLILQFITELAEYERLAHEVVATIPVLEETLFGDRRNTEVLIGEYQGAPVAYALYLHNFSTFTGRPGIYLEDLYVKPAMRGRGFGKVLLSYIASLAVARKCTRFEWSVLDWNEPSIQFYRSIGAVAMDEWTVQRLHGKALHDFAAQFEH